MLKKLETTNSSQWQVKNVLNFTEIDLVIQVVEKARFNKFKKNTQEDVTKEVLSNSKAKKYLENEKYENNSC